MEKDFDKWNSLKKEVDQKNIFDEFGNVVFFAKVKDLFWCHIGVNVGNEQNGKNEDFERPAVILARLSSTTYLIAPTTSKFKENNYRKKIHTNDGKFSFALIDQIKVIDVRRLKRKIGVIIDEDFIELQKVLSLAINCETPLSQGFSEPEGTVDKL